MAAGRPQPSRAPQRNQPPRPSTGRSGPGSAPPKPVVIKPHWAEFKEPQPGKSTVTLGDVPKEWAGDDVAVAGQFYPTPIWDAPGAQVEGTYLGLSENRGPNNQRMYHFKHDDGRFFDMWGATSLDARFDAMLQAGQLYTGYRMLITFLGDVPTKRGQNPTHTFDVRAKFQAAEQAQP